MSPFSVNEMIGPEGVFFVKLPGRVSPTCVQFQEKGDGGTITVAGQRAQLSGEWDLTTTGAAIFKILGSPSCLGVTSQFKQQVVDFLTPLADEVDKCEREQVVPSSSGEADSFLPTQDGA